MAAACALLNAQSTAPSPAFEAVSIRPSPRVVSSVSPPSTFSGGPGSADPEWLTIRNWSVEPLILRAYNLPGDYQLSGLDRIPQAREVPLPWIEVDKFDITANIPAGASAEDVRRMLQSMLAERFSLKVHFERSEVASYDLVALKSLHGLRPSVTADEAEPPRKPFTLPPAGAPFELDSNGFPIIPKDLAVTRISANHGRTREEWRRTTMKKLAAELASLGPIQRPVKDITGLEGEFDFTLYWTQENIGWTDGAQDRPPAEPLGGPSIFEALEKQLGLKLVPSRTRIDVLVIDHIGRTPTPN